MNDHEQNMKRLIEIGYTCEHPEGNLKPVRVDGTPSRGCVYLEREGKWPPMIYLDRLTGTVLVLGGLDYPIDEFIRRDADGWTEPVGKALRGQKELF